MLVSIREVASLLRNPRAPDTRVALAFDGETLLEARSGDAAFPIVDNQPVLIDFDESIVRHDHFSNARRHYSLINGRRNLPRRVKGRLFGTAGESRRHIHRLRTLLVEKTTPARPLVLMVGAGQLSLGAEALYADPAIALVAFDIYPSSLTTFVADAHRIPFADDSVDAICIQAVLEHVLDPARVAAEIWRVLKPEGLLYAETPFMQQVHEGAYDFTRFSELGHRWLFRRFDVVARGALGGPGLSAFWAMKYFFWGVTRSRWLGNLLSAPFGLFALLDHFVPPGYAIDGANGVYFLGRKSARSVGPQDLASDYLGAQR